MTVQKIRDTGRNKTDENKKEKKGAPKQMITLSGRWKRYLLFALAVLLLGGGSVLVGVTGPRFLGAGPGLATTACATPTMTTATTMVATGTASPIATATTTPRGALHVSGTHIVDGTGRPVVLRGSQIESGFNYIKQWRSGKKPTSVLTSTVVQAMSEKWKMDELRIPISNWIYAPDPTGYLGQLDQVVGEANAAGLYVILDLHDSAQSGSPYGKGANVPKVESVAFWKVIAAHYKSNLMLLFDPFNEPGTTSWQEWLHGGKRLPGGAAEVGFQDLVNAIRGVGAQQIIVLEPGSAGKGAGRGNGTRAAEEGGWATFPLADAIGDPSLMYSLHVYHGIADSAAQQDTKWGPILGHFPRIFGEWSFLPNSLHPYQCRGVPHDQADQIVNAFLHYMDGTAQNGAAVGPASWVAWDFAAYHLIQDTTNFTPTTLDIPWTCGDVTSHAGMGTLVQQHLLALASGTNPTVTVTPTP